MVLHGSTRPQWLHAVESEPLQVIVHGSVCSYNVITCVCSNWYDSD